MQYVSFTRVTIHDKSHCNSFYELKNRQKTEKTKMTTDKRRRKKRRNAILSDQKEINDSAIHPSIFQDSIGV